MEQNPILLRIYAAAMAALTVLAELEPDRLVWFLGVSGALVGVALFPSLKWWQNVAKLVLGALLAGAASTSLSASHYVPVFLNPHMTALWLGFAGPALFMASLTKGGFKWPISRAE